jgi:hypothetical protein
MASPPLSFADDPTGEWGSAGRGFDAGAVMRREESVSPIERTRIAGSYPYAG